MITLATLPKATEQQVSEQIESHMLKQGVRSMSGARCSYRGDDGCMCAAGCLIADDEYRPEMEGNTWVQLVYDMGVPGEHSRLIRRYQRIHDNIDPDGWKAVFDSGIIKVSDPEFDQSLSEAICKYFVAKETSDESQDKD